MKKNEHLLDEIGKIDDELIKEADGEPSRKSARIRKRRINIASVSVLAVAAVFMLAIFLPGLLGKGQPSLPIPIEPIPTEPQPTPIVPQENKSPSNYVKFADYIPYEYEGGLNVPEYSVEKDLSNIVNLNQFTDFEYFFNVAVLTQDAKDKIAQNGFVVDDGESWTEFFGIYEQNRYNFAPSFITTDSTTHSFHLMFDYILKNLEQEKLADLLKELSAKLVQDSLAQYDELAGTDFENAAKRNIAFYSVGAKLIDDGFEVPTIVKDAVEKEIELIEAHSGIEISPILNMGEEFENPTDYQNMDYTQYIPRSHYTQTETLKAYFKAQMWYGLATFRSGYEDEVKSAVLQTALLNVKENEELWYSLFSPISFFVGECDDITYIQYANAIAEVYGEDGNGETGLTDLNTVTDPEKFAAAFEIIKKLEPPKINSVPVYEEDVQPDIGKAITGFRFLGQRFTIDASIFQQLMDRQTPGRMLPKALDIPAAFGSELATNILKDEGEMDDYPEYGPNLEKVQEYTKSIDTDTWTSNLYWSWLYMLRPLTENREDLPLFMQNEAWQLKSLNTFEGSWTELKHDTLLYAKQPMAEMGAGGFEGAEPDDRGYVEPNPVLYGRLTSLVAMTTDGLKSRGLLTAKAEESLGVLHDMAQTLTTIAEKELKGEALTDEEYEAIRNYGGELEHIWGTAAEKDISVESDLDPGAIVADVATDPNGQVLEEATGYAKAIYVAFPRDGEVVLGRGSVYSQYEFTVPIDKRMTDEDWHLQLGEGDTPDIASWKTPFMANIGK
jgi:hypothetical protein